MCEEAELQPGQMRCVRLGRMDVVVVRSGSGALHALPDRCIHQGGPLSAGSLGPSIASREVGSFALEEEGKILRCPWHGYEYDVETGCAVFDQRRRLRKFKVTVDNGRVVVER